MRVRPEAHRSFEKLPKTTTDFARSSCHAAAFLFVVDGGATEFSTLVVSVIDGDTIEVLQYQSLSASA